MTEKVVEPTPYNDAQFLWCTTWCEKQDLNPYDAENWAAAKAEYLKALKEVS